MIHGRFITTAAMPSQLYLPLMSAIRNHSTAALCVSLKQPRPSAFQLALINLKFTAVALYMTPPKQSPFKQYLHISVLHCPPRKVLNASPPLWGSRNGPERDSPWPRLRWRWVKRALCAQAHKYLQVSACRRFNAAQAEEHLRGSDCAHGSC